MPSSFEKLEAFDDAVDLTVAIYGATKSFPDDERFGMTSQIRRAASSVVRHLAEGQGRLTQGEWRQFLSQARGSLYEVEASLILAMRLKMLDLATYGSLRETTANVARKVNGLIDYARMKEQKEQARKGQARRGATSTVNR
jgi:four helix bundle protein